MDWINSLLNGEFLDKTCKYPNCSYFALLGTKTHCCVAEKCDLATSLRLGYPEVDKHKLERIEERRIYERGNSVKRL